MAKEPGPTKQAFIELRAALIEFVRPVRVAAEWVLDRLERWLEEREKGGE